MSRFSSSLQADLSLFAQNPTRRWSCVGQLKAKINQSVDQGQFSAGSMSRGVVVRFVTAANYGVLPRVLENGMRGRRVQCDGQIRSLSCSTAVSLMSFV